MNIGKTLAVSAVSGILMGVLAGCGDTKPAQADPKVPTADTTAPAAKDCCKGKNECKGKGGCKTDSNECAGQNACKSKGGCNGHCPT